jgi:hypothetical protein
MKKFFHKQKYFGLLKLSNKAAYFKGLDRASSGQEGGLEWSLLRGPWMAIERR